MSMSSWNGLVFVLLLGALLLSSFALAFAAEWGVSLTEQKDLVDIQHSTDKQLVESVEGLVRWRANMAQLLRFLSLIAMFFCGLLYGLANRMSNSSPNPLCSECGGFMKPMLRGGYRCRHCGEKSTPRE